MKSSKYNICLPYEDHYVIFNGITKRFFQVSSQNKEAFLRILSAPDEYKEQYAPFLQRMAKEGFIIEDDIDEVEVVKQQYEDQNNASIYKLMILPTYACNVSCWYCTQWHRNMRLNEEDVRKIKAHIAYYLAHHDIKRLHLSWFGGEPLLGLHRMMEIATFAYEYCQEHDITCHNAITTNGTLLTRDTLEKMHDLNFTFFQITVDGTQKEHDKVKEIKGKSAYEMTLRNICLITEILPDAEICLRYNYTAANLKPEEFTHDLKRYLPEKVRKHIRLSLMKVWQEDETKIDDGKINSLVSIASDLSFQVSMGQGFGTCYVDHTHFNCIFPNGRIGKCDNLDPEAAQGKISEAGEIIWEKDIPSTRFTIFSDSSSECLTCKYLPVCYGPCPKERDETYRKGDYLKCRFKDADLLWRPNILYYCRRFLYVLPLLFSPYVAFAQTDSLHVTVRDTTAVNDSIYKSVSLDNVTITGSNVTHYPDKDVWLITDSMRKGAYSVRELMGNLPGFYYNPVSRSVSYRGNSNILFLLDGKEKHGKYIGNLAHIRFDKIEIILNPSGKYEDYHMVINMITKENWKGYDVNLETREDIQPSSPYDHLFSMVYSSNTYTYTQPKYDIATNYEYEHTNERKKQEYWEKTTSYEEWSVDKDRPTDINYRNAHHFWIDADYRLNKNHTLSFRYSLRGTHSNNYLVRTMERVFQNGEHGGIVDEDSRMHQDEANHIGTISYTGKINTWELSSGLTYQKLPGHSSNTYGEDHRQLYLTPYDNTKDYMYWDIDVIKRIRRKGTLHFGTSAIYRKYYSESLDHLSESSAYRNTVYASYSLSWSEKLRTVVGGSLRSIREKFSIMEDDRQNIFGVYGSLNYNPSDEIDVSLSYSNTAQHPYQLQLNTNGRWVNTNVYAVGNPNLRSNIAHTVKLSTNIGPISLSSSFKYAGNGISQIYRYEDDITILTYGNNKSWDYNCEMSVDHSWDVLNGQLTITGDINYQAHSSEWNGDRHQGASWTGSAYLIYKRQGFPTLNLSYDKLSDEKITAQGKSTTGMDVWSAYMIHSMLKGRLQVIIIYYLPISLGVNKYASSIVETPFYSNSSRLNLYEQNKNKIGLSLVYRFAKGRRVWKTQTIQNIEN